MKAFVFFLLVTGLTTGVANAQIRKIPASVTETFKQKYPSADNVEWKDKLSVFTATFDLDGKKHEARINNKGEWLSTEESLEETELPAEVKEGFDKSKYSDWKVEESHKIELPGDKVEYRLEVAKNDIQKKNLVFNSKGKLLRDKITL